MSTFQSLVSWAPLFARRRVFVVNVDISHSFNVVAPEVFQVIKVEHHHEYSIAPFEFSFDDLRSRRIYDFCEEQLLNLETPVNPRITQNLVDSIVECGTNLASRDGENCGYDINARLDVDYFRIANEEELALFMQFDDDAEDVFEDMEDEDDDDEVNLRFRGVEKGRYDGGDGKEMITCSVCLEDLSSGTEFNKLPCSHIFHSSCIDPWLKRNTSCPNCRTKLELEEPGHCCGRDNSV